jgi:hypothetical protein
VAESRWQQLAGTAVAAIAVVVILWRGFPVILRRYREAAARRRQTEGHAFRQMGKALGSGDGPAAYWALLRWVERLQPGMDTRTFAARYGDEALTAALTALSATVYRDPGNPGNLSQIHSKLAAARKRYLAERPSEREPGLPPLNP